ncbi:alpha/beta fold hydrolase [Novosphingobium sp. 9U]|uniref:alpha/beta fold hydrolase n=1 Tax=Novosphingobium sp. 9U TaxID=2653158 RepID=UPI0012F38A9C|nr:alpha/beta hydrolase [Novosphingobium sp. 9U]VWX54010.1 AB hydrolase superfamily protein YvaM [Novosphingobium sp. 9U]
MSEPDPYRHHRYRSGCGRLNLCARVYEGEGPSLLLMHGLTRNSGDFEPLAAHLGGRYRLIVRDQRGRGLSEYDADPANYRPDVYAADMFALLDSLSVERVTTIGTSMGGLIAMIMAAMQSARVQAMLLNDIGPQIEATGLARIQGYVGPTDDTASWEEAATRCAAINGSAFPNYERDDWVAFAPRNCMETPEGRIRFAYDPAIAAGTTGDDLATVPPDLWPLWDILSAVPVLVLRGASSALLSAETVTEMGCRHAGSFTAVEVPARGHAPMLDEPTATAAIDAFLQEFVDDGHKTRA